MNKRIGSSFEDFLEETDLKDEVEGLAQKRVYTWQVRQGMEELPTEAPALESERLK